MWGEEVKQVGEDKASVDTMLGKHEKKKKNSTKDSIQSVTLIFMSGRTHYKQPLGVAKATLLL